MASQAALRPLLRLTRPSVQIARITTTTRTKAAAAPAPAPAPAPATLTPAPAPALSKPAPAKPASKYVAPAKRQPIAATNSTPKPPSPSPPPPTLPQSDASSATTSSTPPDQPNDGSVDWTRSYYGLGTARFPKEIVDILLQPVNLADVEVKPDGIIYLPEIKYRRILNQAFGPGGWGLVPKGDVVVGEKIVTREYALIAEGRFISQAQGENGYFGLEGLPSAVEGCKSNALMRCCKDLGIASDLWDPVFIRQFKKAHAMEVWCEHVVTGKKRIIWTRKDVPIAYPYKKTAN